MNKKVKKKFDKLHRKATAKDSVRALNKLTDVVDGRRVIVPDPPVIQRLDDFVRQEDIAQIGESCSAARHGHPPSTRREREIEPDLDLRDVPQSVESACRRPGAHPERHRTRCSIGA